ncbi:MAG TPA: chorismate synthase [Clostridia bacterium]
MRYLTAGESHGKALVGIMDGCPANLEITEEYINRQLYRRQQGFGRGERMKIETDQAQILSGVRNKLTLGSPIALMIENKDHKNWQDIMSAGECDVTKRVVTTVRPAHADLAGALKYNQKDARNILERASARETAMRVALGAIARRFLEELGVKIYSHTTMIGGVYSEYYPKDLKELEKADLNPIRCLDEQKSQLMIEKILEAKENGDTLGGQVQVIASGMAWGYGSHTQYDRKLDARIMADIASIQSVKSVGIGLGARYGELTGLESHDEIGFRDNKFFRCTNNSGGIDGGISTGEDIVVNVTLKPIPTTMRGLKTVDLITKEECVSQKERSDVCAVPAAGVVCENVLALTLMQVILETLGGDHMDEVKQRWLQKQASVL